MEAIAAEAGVAVRRVYSAYRAKREILSTICENWLEDADARGLAARTLAEPDPKKRLRSAAHWLRNLYDHGFDVVTVFEAAGDEDEETRSMLRAKLKGRNHVMDSIIASLQGGLTKSIRTPKRFIALSPLRGFTENSSWRLAGHPKRSRTGLPMR